MSNFRYQKRRYLVDVVDYKPLYDFNNKLIAYSLDLKSKITNKYAFAIISTSEDDGPILEFGTGGKSPYDKIADNNQTYIFQVRQQVLGLYEKYFVHAPELSCEPLN